MEMVEGEGEILGFFLARTPSWKLTCAIDNVNFLVRKNQSPIGLKDCLLVFLGFLTGAIGFPWSFCERKWTHFGVFLLNELDWIESWCKSLTFSGDG
ncbi:hypothetical protein L6452_38122 [Arctium lappa]|uniref:Uncharacterized protein n=1 Tax=Arctium lappa TaxID=4217 RepID=A0ACB8Y4V2_ARCLA|nr:hypothetical protein L6452_38122 [Arctium lappa]